ncbi:(2Fe-2S)-binding protein [Heliobacterium chlorum]|uniref:(2Fe-2S)-binding protein n=1 Tax=Heliobacterium chlorum TaxID=2698 RepID=A0ABR7T0U4_HELCL|nr:(2Fe-2S)-binding protein [Heliobacterium chlorum]MBC9784414.1 (2Fe-2S)-binding protein [Heliobacterium chlorum]
MDAKEVVCFCKKVTYGDLQKAIENGAKTFDSVQEVTKVSTGCKKCTDKAKALVNELLAK